MATFLLKRNLRVEGVQNKFFDYTKLQIGEKYTPVRQSKVYKYGCETARNQTKFGKYGINSKRNSILESRQNFYDITNNLTPRLELRGGDRVLFKSKSKTSKKFQERNVFGLGSKGLPSTRIDSTAIEKMKRKLDFDSSDVRKLLNPTSLIASPITEKKYRSNKSYLKQTVCSKNRKSKVKKEKSKEKSTVVRKLKKEALEKTQSSIEYPPANGELDLTRNSNMYKVDYNANTKTKSDNKPSHKKPQVVPKLKISKTTCNLLVKMCSSVERTEKVIKNSRDKRVQQINKVKNEFQEPKKQQESPVRYCTETSEPRIPGVIPMHDSEDEEGDSCHVVSAKELIPIPFLINSFETTRPEGYLNNPVVLPQPNREIISPEIYLDDSYQTDNRDHKPYI